MRIRRNKNLLNLRLSASNKVIPMQSSSKGQEAQEHEIPLENQKTPDLKTYGSRSRVQRFKACPPRAGYVLVPGLHFGGVFM